MDFIPQPFTPFKFQYAITTTYFHIIDGHCPPYPTVVNFTIVVCYILAIGCLLVYLFLVVEHGHQPLPVTTHPLLSPSSIIRHRDHNPHHQFLPHNPFKPFIIIGRLAIGIFINSNLSFFILLYSNPL